jgi:hypothetical protein
MDIAAKKLELIDWLMHTTDINLINQLEKIKSKFSNEKKQQPVFGRLKDKIVIADDFDAPLEDFKDYM